MNTMLLASLIVVMIMAISAKPSDRLPKPIISPEKETGVEKRSLSLSEYRIDQLNKHNAFRAIHNAQPLTLDATLNAEAQAFAEYQMANNQIGQHCSAIKSQNIPNIGCDLGTTQAGENLAWTSLQNDAHDGSTPWYNEVDLYDFCNHGATPGTGHFTAMVWKATTKIGIGRAIGSTGTFIVARYTTKGNMRGQYHINVGDAPASLNRPPCPATEPPSPERLAACDAIGVAYGRDLYYDNYTPLPNEFGAHPCDVVCSQRIPGANLMLFSREKAGPYITEPYDCVKPDGTDGFCSTVSGQVICQ